MKTILFAVITCLMAATAYADISIAVGQPGRGYEAYGKKIAERLPGAEIVNYAGSDAISIAVCDGDAQVGIIQNDAKYHRAKEGCTLRSMGEYPTVEYAFILFPEGSRYDELSDLREGDSVLVDEVGSGTDLFWTTIKQIEKEHGNGSKWAKATRVNDMMLFADGMASDGSIHAVIYVGDPNSTEIHEMIGNGWKLGELYDKDINDMQVGGESLYGRERVIIDLPGWGGKSKNDAYVVKSFIVATKEFLQQDRTAARNIALAVKGAQ